MTPPKTRDECPQATPCPRGYIAWQEWADKMSKTHQQAQCNHCGLWTIWVKK